VHAVAHINCYFPSNLIAHSIVLLLFSFAFGSPDVGFWRGGIFLLDGEDNETSLGVVSGPALTTITVVEVAACVLIIVVRLCV
jgi:hypothetical protein